MTKHVMCYLFTNSILKNDFCENITFLGRLKESPYVKGFEKLPI